MSKKSGMISSNRGLEQNLQEKGVTRSKTTRKKEGGKEKKAKRLTAKQSRKTNR